MNLDLSQLKVSPSILIFLTRGDEVLTLKRPANKQIFPNKLSGVGGKVEPGEDIPTAAARELAEETGLTATDLKLKGNLFVFMGNGYINVLYILVGTQFSGQLTSNPEEGIASWMKTSDFLASPDRVDHIGYYFQQIIQPNSDLYTGIAIREHGVIVSYTDNTSHFSSRKPPALATTG